MELHAEAGAGSREVPKPQTSTRRPGWRAHRPALVSTLRFGASLELGVWGLVREWEI